MALAAKPTDLDVWLIAMDDDPDATAAQWLGDAAPALAG